MVFLYNQELLILSVRRQRFLFSPSIQPIKIGFVCCCVRSRWLLCTTHTNTRTHTRASAHPFLSHPSSIRMCCECWCDTNIWSCLFELWTTPIFANGSSHCLYDPTSRLFPPPLPPSHSVMTFVFACVCFPALVSPVPFRLL